MNFISKKKKKKTAPEGLASLLPISREYLIGSAWIRCPIKDPGLHGPSRAEGKSSFWVGTQHLEERDISWATVPKDVYFKYEKTALKRTLEKNRP